MSTTDNHSSTSEDDSVPVPLGWDGILDTEFARLFGLIGISGYFIIAPLTYFVSEENLDKALELSVSIVVVLLGFSIPTLLGLLPILQRVINRHQEGDYPVDAFHRSTIEAVTWFTRFGALSLFLILVYFAWPSDENRPLIGGLAASLVIVSLVSITRYPRFITGDLRVSEPDSSVDSDMYGSVVGARLIDLLLWLSVGVYVGLWAERKFMIPGWSSFLWIYMVGVVYEGLTVGLYSKTLGLLLFKRLVIHEQVCTRVSLRSAWTRASLLYSPVLMIGIASQITMSGWILGLSVLISLGVVLLNSGLIHSQSRGAYDILAHTVIVRNRISEQ